MERFYQSPQETIILITKKQYEEIVHSIFISQTGYEEYRNSIYSKGPFKNYTKFGLKSIGDEDVNQYLSKFNARLGEVRKKYNPYSWGREMIFNTEQDAVMFCLKVF